MKIIVLNGEGTNKLAATVTDILDSYFNADEERVVLIEPRSADNYNYTETEITVFNSGDVVDEIKRRKLFLFDIWGYVPGSGPGDYWQQFEPPEGVFKMLESRLGERWLGMDVGEQDGRYIGGHAPQMIPTSAGHFQQYLPGHFQPEGHVVGTVQMRIGYQPTPAQRGAGLLEIHPHDEIDPVLHLVVKPFELFRVIEGHRLVMNRTRAYNAQHPVVFFGDDSPDGFPAFENRLEALL